MTNATMNQAERIEVSWENQELAAEVQRLKNEQGILNDKLRQVATVLELTAGLCGDAIANRLCGAQNMLAALIERTNGSGVSVATLQAEVDKAKNRVVDAVARGNRHYRNCGCSICRNERGDGYLAPL